MIIFTVSSRGVLEELDLSKLTKLYYSIGEVADLFGVNTSLIRFWEKEFPLIQPKKSKSGNRLFTVKDIAHFNKIYQLVKIQGYTLEGAKKAIKSKPKKDEEPKIEASSENESKELIIQRLEVIKSSLMQLKSDASGY